MKLFLKILLLFSLLNASPHVMAHQEFNPSIENYLTQCPVVVQSAVSVGLALFNMAELQGAFHIVKDPHSGFFLRSWFAIEFAVHSLNFLHYAFDLSKIMDVQLFFQKEIEHQLGEVWTNSLLYGVNVVASLVAISAFEESRDLVHLVDLTLHIVDAEYYAHSLAASLLPPILAGLFMYYRFLSHRNILSYS